MATAALAYGDSLAHALWRQRLRTLHTATTMKSYDRLRGEHERVARIAEIDSLTGVANRRAFDHAVEAMGGRATTVTSRSFSSTWTRSSRSMTPAACRG